MKTVMTVEIRFFHNKVNAPHRLVLVSDAQLVLGRKQNHFGMDDQRNIGVIE